jgi:lipopolysaccharide/colanic/teichoic acid biosynthesis glycosyltransferase
VRLWQLIDSETRQTDLLATCGPDGAIVFCPATPPEGAKELAERLRSGAGSLPIGIGVACFRADGVTLADLVACASAREIDVHGGPDGGSDPGGSAVFRGRPAPNAWSQRASRAIKRLFDLSVVGFSAPLWLPLLAAVAALVKISDPRSPVLFRQERTGRGGRRFEMIKFRTMVPDAETLKSQLGVVNERSWPDFKIESDPRITPIGRWLRASSLDELPQLWNVLRGEMSLVGPRPTSFSADTYEAWQTARLEATPGLTGLWQVEARNCTDFSERIRLDLRYVANRGFLYDLKILLRTIPAVLWDREGR